MLKNVQHFQQPNSNKEMLRQTSVQCNESCEVHFKHAENKVQARIRGLHWNGFTLDQIPLETWNLKPSEEEFNIRFAVPRQFGHVKLALTKVKWKPYLDVISQREMVSLDVDLENDPQLKNIQDFLIYRNKSFIRRSKRRIKKTLSQKSLYFFWAFIVTLCVFWGLVMLKESLFGE